MLNKKEALQKEITIYWWNMGKKTLDFKGTYENYFKKRNIKLRVNLLGGNYQTTICYFKIPLSSSEIKLKISCNGSEWDFIRCCDNALNLFLFQLGDKTLFDGQREYKLNW